jgi:hypothetical protein
VLEHRDATIATLTADNTELKHVGARTTASTFFFTFLLAVALFLLAVTLFLLAVALLRCVLVLFAFSLSLVRSALNRP